MTTPWFRELLDAAPDVYFRIALRPSRRVAYLSRGIESLTGYAPADLMGDARLCLALVPKAARRDVLRLARGRRPAVVSLDLRRKDRGTMRVDVRLVPVVRQRRIVAVEGVVSPARTASETAAASAAHAIPQPVQQRLAALLYEVHDLLHGWMRHSDQSDRPQELVSAARTNPLLRIGDVVLDADRMRVTERGVVVDVTTRELMLLRCLLQHRGRVLTRAQLLSQVWDYAYTGDDRTVDVHISRLRRKLPALRGVLRAVKHIGYCLDEERAEGSAGDANRRVANI